MDSFDLLPAQSDRAPGNGSPDIATPVPKRWGRSFSRPYGPEDHQKAISCLSLELGRESAGPLAEDATVSRSHAGRPERRGRGSRLTGLDANLPAWCPQRGPLRRGGGPAVAGVFDDLEGDLEAEGLLVCPGERLMGADPELVQPRVRAELCQRLAGAPSQAEPSPPRGKSSPVCPR